MRARTTLTRHLLAWALGALLVVWAAFVAFGYAAGQHEADELTDGHLASVSALLLASGGQPAPLAAGEERAPPLRELKAHDYQQSMSVVVWDAAGRVVARTGSAPLPTFSGQEGFATQRIGEPAQPWRTFSRWDAAHQRLLMVLLSERERDALADDIAGQVSEPGLWLLPVVALVLGLAIHRGLRPLHDVAREAARFDIHAARPLPLQPRYREPAAIVDAVNQLVDRYQGALGRERALGDEFAHELRTPLAALALQARAAREGEGAARDAALEALEQEVRRAGEVMSHMLALARASRAELAEAAQPVDLPALAASVVAALAPAAHAGGRELGLEAAGPLVVQGHAQLLDIALRNLVDNALHHTPPGTQVEVRVDAAGRWLEVAYAPPAAAAPPTGPPPPQGVLGWGLGHRVVEKVATLHGARFEDLPVTGPGRRYRITFATG